MHDASAAGSTGLTKWRFESGLGCRELVFLLAITGQREQQRLLHRRCKAKLLRDLIAVQDRQPDVEHDRLRREARGNLERLVAVSGGAHFVTRPSRSRWPG